MKYLHYLLDASFYIVAAILLIVIIYAIFSAMKEMWGEDRKALWFIGGIILIFVLSSYLNSSLMGLGYLIGAFSVGLSRSPMNCHQCNKKLKNWD